MSIARILVIAGSDSGGGAGIQADIKTITMLGGHAMTAITAITAQNTLGVRGVHAVPVDMVLAQIDAVVSDIGVDAVKIGMIGSAETADAVANYLSTSLRRKPESREAGASDAEEDSGFRRNDEGEIPIVFDPVMISTSGSILADGETISAFARLMDIATVVTPNVPELAALTGCRIEAVDAMELAAAKLVQRHGCSVLAKGGHLERQAGEDEPVVHDLLVLRDGVVEYMNPRIDTAHTHGTGCTLASGVAEGLGAGLALEDAVDRAEHFVRCALAAAPALGSGSGPMGHGLGLTPFYHMLAAMDEQGWDAAAFAAKWPRNA